MLGRHKATRKAFWKLGAQNAKKKKKVYFLKTLCGIQMSILHNLIKLNKHKTFLFSSQKQERSRSDHQITLNKILFFLALFKMSKIIHGKCLVNELISFLCP